jgi:hypothetical protein
MKYRAVVTAGFRRKSLFDEGSEYREIAERCVYLEASIAAFKIIYRDSLGLWDGVHWDGEQASFFAFQETDEALARKKLLSREEGRP